MELVAVEMDGAKGGMPVMQREGCKPMDIVKYSC